MCFVFQNATDITGPITYMDFWPLMSATLNCKCMRAGSQLRHGCSIFMFFNMFRYGSIPKERLHLLYVLSMGCVATLCISIPRRFLNCIITAVLQYVRKFDGSLLISISYCTISSFTLVTHVINPMECSVFISSYTCVAIVSAGIWYRRFI